MVFIRTIRFTNPKAKRYEKLKHREVLDKKPSRNRYNSNIFKYGKMTLPIVVFNLRKAHNIEKGN